MRRHLRGLAIASLPLLALCALSAWTTASAQKPGGTLNISHFDSPASMSLHEEATAAAVRPMMGVFNNLVMYRQDVAQASLQSIVPDLATGWNWSEDGKELTFPLHQGVPPRTSNAPGICCRAKPVRSSASTRARAGTITSRK
jgi:peptide/nickel transport system substrate-binding protein